MLTGMKVAVAALMCAKEEGDGVTAAAADDDADADEDDEAPEVPNLKTGKAKVVCIEGDVSPAEFELEENTSIGRSPSNDIVLKEPKVSRQHAAINLIDGNYVIVDLKSSNGIHVNGRKVEEVVLEDGDELVIGNSKFTFYAGS